MKFLKCSPFSVWLGFVLIFSTILAGGWYFGKDSKPLPAPPYRINSFQLTQLLPALVISAKEGYPEVVASEIAKISNKYGRLLSSDSEYKPAKAYFTIETIANSISNLDSITTNNIKAAQVAEAVWLTTTRSWDAVIFKGSKKGRNPSEVTSTTTTSLPPAGERVYLIPLPSIE